MATEVESKEPPISESGSIGAAAATDNTSISHETAKNEALCTVAVETSDSSEGQIIVEAPKETLSKHAGIASEEHKSKGDLTSNGDNIEAKEVTAAKEPAEKESSDVNVMATNNESAKEENTSQNSLPQKDQDQDNKLVHAQVTEFDIIKASKAQAKEKEGEGTTDNEMHEVSGDNMKREAENRMLSDESTNSIYNTAEPFEKKNSKEPPEIMNEGLEPIDKFESPIAAVPEEQDVEKSEKVDEDEHVKTEAETGICNFERTNITDCTSVAECSEEGITRESLEKTSEEQVEPAKGEQEHYKPESFHEPEEEKLKRVNEDDINIETDTEICAEKGLDYADSMSVSENSDKEIEQEPPEVTAKNGPEPATEESEHGKLGTSLDAVPDEPEEKAEAENETCDDERTKKFEPEHGELEESLDEVTGEPEEDLERVIEDEKIKMEDETELRAEERTTDADCISVAEPSENESRQEPKEIMVREAHEPAEDVPEKSERESTLDAVLEKPEGSMLLNNGSESCRPNRNHENESTSKEDVVMNAPEDGKEYEPIEKEALNLPPEYESGSVGAAAATDNSSISHDTARDEALGTVAVGTLDGSEGQIIVEAPKETLSKHAEIASEELKDEGDLASTGDNIEAKEKVTAATEPAESESSDVNIMAIDNERAKEVNASQHRLQQKDQDQDNKIVHAQVTKTDIVEASEAQAEDKEDENTTDNEKHEVNGDNINREAENQMLSDESIDSIYSTSAAEPSTKIKDSPEIMNEAAGKFESHIGAVPEEPDVEKFGRTNEDEHVKVEAETRTCNLERTNVSDYVSLAEPSGEGSTQESLENTSKEELEPAKGEQAHDKPESFKEPEEEKLKRVDEDDIKMEAETEICADKELDYADSMSVAENLDKEVEQEPPELTAKNGPEHEKEESEHGKLETSLDTVPNKPEEKAEAENGTGDDKRTKKFESEHEMLEKSLDEVTGEPEEELEKVTEDKKIKMEAETEHWADERTTDADSISVAEPSESESRQEPKEIMVKEAHEPAENIPEKSERESTLDVVLEKPEASMPLNSGSESCMPNRNHENKTTSKEDLVLNAPEDDEEYEPTEPEALHLLPKYESTYVGAAAATENSGISHKAAKDEAFCTVAVGTLDSSEGQIMVEAPKETVTKHAEIASEELKNERDLTSNGDNTEAKENVTAANDLEESETSDVNVVAIHKKRATHETMSQDSLHQKDQDDNIVHAQAKKVEASEAEAGDKEDKGVTDIEKLEGNGDKIKKEAENGMPSDERANDIDSTPAAEPLEKNNSEELHEIMKKDLEPEDKLESPIEAAAEELDAEKLERVNEAKYVKVEAETGNFNDERTDGIDFISLKEPSEKGNTEEYLEKTSKEKLEAAEDEPGHEKLKSLLDSEEEKLGRVNEDNDKIEGEAEICADERTDDVVHSMTVAEPSDNKQEPVEIATKEDPESAKDEPEQGKLESSLEPVAHELEEKEIERIDEDTSVKKEAENGISDDKITNGIDSISAVEPSDKENRQEPLEMTAKENLEPEKDELDHIKLEKSLHVVTKELEEKLERVIEDKKIKFEAETEICDKEQTADVDSAPVLEPSENENRQEPIEVTAKEDLEPAEDVPEHSEPESSLGAVLQKPEASMVPDGPESRGLNRNHEIKAMSMEDLVTSLDERSLEDEKKHEPLEKEADDFIQEYENIHVGNDKHEEIPDSTCEEQPQETINHSIDIELDGKERELSQKLELVSDSVAEDKNHEVIRQKDFDVSPDDILQNVISEMVEKNDDEESTMEANLNKAFDDNHDSHVFIEETINKEVGQKKEEGSSSAYDDQNHQATDTTDKLEVHVSREKETQQNIFQVSLPEDRCQKEKGESDTIKIDNSSNDEDPKTMIPGAADLCKDAETAKEKSEENLHTAKEDCSDDHTSIEPILPDQIGEHEDSSETEYGEQISRVISDECSIQADIHKETADPEEFEKITESITKDHNQGDVIEPKSADNSDNTDNLDEAIPEITAHGDDPETAKVEDEDVLGKDFSYKCDDQESYLGAAKCEDNEEASIHEKTENLDSNTCLEPEDQSHVVLCETESVKVEKEQNIDENEKSSAVRTEYITDATSGAKLEEISVGDSYEGESDDKQDNTVFEITEEKMPKEETAGHILEKTLSTLNTNTFGDISENQIEGKDSAKNTNSIIIGCEQNQATEEEIPEVASRDRNKESDVGDDSTTNGTTSEEVKVSDTAGVAKKLTETVEVQISEDASQVMKVDAYECQDYEENDECKENTNTSQMLEKSVQNENEEKINKIHDDLAVTSTPSDEATHGNLQKNEGKKATTEDYGTGDGISNQEANESEDGELKDKGSITISNDNACDIPALDEEHGQVENAHQAAESSCDHIHGSISISEVDNLDARIIENKIEQKSYESDRECESNESVRLKETTENDSGKEKLEDSEPEKSTHAVVEDLEITTGAECIQESETNNVSTKNNNEENFLKDKDMKRVEPATELKPDQQSNNAIYATEGTSPIEETINTKDLVDDVAKEKAHNEDKQCEEDDVSVAHNLVEESVDMEGKQPHLQKESTELETPGETEQNDSIVAQHEEIAERTATLKLHKDTEHIEQSNLLGNQEIATQIEIVEKDIMPDKGAAEADLEQLLNDETEAKDNSKQVTDTVSNDKVKEDNHQTSKELVMDEAKENSEQVTDNVPNDEVKEDSHQTLKELVMETAKNPITSAGTASQAEETKQEVAEQFSKISDYWPRSYNEEASLINTIDAEHQGKMMSVVEQPEAKQITHTSTDSTAACEIEEQGEYVNVREDSGLDTIHEGREELKQVSDSMPKDVDKMIGSSVGLTEDRKNQKEESAVQETQVDQPDVVTETEELTDKAGHEIEVDKLPEEKQQTGLGELPVSQFLMKYILQEECDTLNEACDREYENVLSKQNDGDKHNKREVPKQEEKSASLSVVQLKEETSITKDREGSEKLENISESVKEEGYEGKENSDTVCKDSPSLQSTLDLSTSSLVVTEDGKDEVGTLSSEMSNNIAKDESMEMNSTEKNNQGSTVGNEHRKPDLVLDEKIEGTVLGETLMQEEINKDNENLDKEADVSTFSKTSEEDNLQKEGGQESKECLQDAVKAKGSYEVSDGQSTMDDSEYGEILETESKIEKVECGDEKQEAGNQEQILKDNSTEEVIPSEIQQDDHVNEAKIHAQETADEFMEDENSAIILDSKQMVETNVDEYKPDEEKDEKEEKEEFKLEKSSSNAAIIETKESELKPIQKPEQTTKSSESPKVEDRELEETLRVGSEVKIVESGAKKEDAVNQNQAQMNNGLNEGKNISEPLLMEEKLEEQISVANVDENHAVQTTETKMDTNEAGDVKDEKEEEEEDEHNPEESGQNSIINVEAREAELKPTPKKSHGLLSGVGSKVKHSIAKVKKAIRGKSSHSKTVSAK